MYEPPQCSLVWCCFVFPPVPINKGLGLTFTSAHILVRALVDGPGSQPTDTMDHIKCVVRAPVAMVAVSLPHVSSPRDWAVAIGSHLQQDMNIPQATPQPSAPFKTNLTSTLAIIVHSKRLSSVSVTARSFRTAKQPCRNNCTLQIRNFMYSSDEIPGRFLRNLSLLGCKGTPEKASAAITAVLAMFRTKRSTSSSASWVAQHFAQHVPPIARTLWACSSVSVASFKRTLPRNMRPPPTLCLISWKTQAFFFLWSTLIRSTSNISSYFASCSYQRRFESLPRELCRTASHFEIECCRLTKKRFEKWREKRVPSFWPPRKQTRGRWLCEGLASPFKEKKKGSGTTELVLWLLREFNRAADKLADWVLLARKIRQFVKHRWDAQRQAPGSASAMLAQHRAPSFSAIASGFTEPKSRHMASISSSSCLCHVSLERLTSHLQWILQAVTHKSSRLFITLLPSASHPEIPVVIMCP